MHHQCCDVQSRMSIKLDHSRRVPAQGFFADHVVLRLRDRSDLKNEPA